MLQRSSGPLLPQYVILRGRADDVVLGRGQLSVEELEHHLLEPRVACHFVCQCAHLLPPVPAHRAGVLPETGEPVL